MVMRTMDADGIRAASRIPPRLDVGLGMGRNDHCNESFITETIGLSMRRPSFLLTLRHRAFRTDRCWTQHCERTEYQN